MYALIQVHHQSYSVTTQSFKSKSSLHFTQKNRGGGGGEGRQGQKGDRGDTHTHDELAGR